MVFKKYFTIIVILCFLLHSISTTTTNPTEETDKTMDYLNSILDKSENHFLTLIKTYKGYRLKTKEDLEEKKNLLFIDKENIYSSCTLFPFKDDIIRAFIEYFELAKDKTTLQRNPVLRNFFHSVLWAYQMIFLKYTETMSMEDYNNQKDNKLIRHSQITKDISLESDKQFVDYAINHASNLSSALKMSRQQRSMSEHLKVNEPLYDNLYMFHEFLLLYLSKKYTDKKEIAEYSKYFNPNTIADYMLLLTYIFNEGFEIEVNQNMEFFSYEEKGLYAQYSVRHDPENLILNKCIVSSPIFPLFEKIPLFNKQTDDEKLGMTITNNGINLLFTKELKKNELIKCLFTTLTSREEAFYKSNIDLFDYYNDITNLTAVEVNLEEIVNTKETQERLKGLVINNRYFLSKEVNINLLNIIRISLLDHRKINGETLNFLLLKQEKINNSNEKFSLVKYFSLMNKISAKATTKYLVADISIVDKAIKIESKKKSFAIEKISDLRRYKNIFVLSLIKETNLDIQKKAACSLLKSVLREEISALKKMIIS